MSNGQQGPPTLTVKIELDRANRHVTCKPNPAFVRPGQRVEWTSTDGPWAIHPVGLSPFDTRSIRGGKGQSNGAKPSANAQFGRYEYMVAVEVDGDIWTEDPEIVIGPME